MDSHRRGQVGREALARLPAHPGLCAGCVHLQLQASARSVFVRCGRSDRDQRFARYPRLPVTVCAGYEPVDEGPAGEPGGGGGVGGCD